MEIRPILSTLRRHKTAAALIVIEIALSCAIVCNALFLIAERLDRMHVPSGIAEDELVRIQAASLRQLGDDDELNKSVAQEYLDVLRHVPGVVQASVATQIPFGNSSNNSGVRLTEDQQMSTLNATVYMDDGNLLETFGLRLIAGRDFTPGEYQELAVLEKSGDEGKVPGAIINRTMAEKLFPGQNAVGKSFYSWGNASIPVVGVVEELIRPNSFDQGQYSMIFPIREYRPGVQYILRTEPARRAEVLKAAVDALKRADPNLLVVEQGTLSELRASFFEQDRSMAWMLVIVIVALLVVTALGIVGLASFWVQQRTRQIGVRRALGATQGQILRYFQTENFLLASAGIVVGMLLAFGINQMLMGKYELPRLPWYYLPTGAVVLWGLGQLSVLWPARRAAAVPPAVATRSA
ncbi:ABC transporter permease [Pseudoxanthomonas sangjuensis]|uniref:ABC transporter permease n=1 Tax=Pseudoxanthomonas sangjuensis TaxID=1503750 RepID=UPI001391F6BF|nr:FtsX-like permease family protein [Pseudoxanthomonas sangjuensis]KAF1714142.1 ABC transporter permease [Pseudoxanthomonas sangjuensis]